MPRGNRARRATPSPECRNDSRPARDPTHPVETDRHPRRDHRLWAARSLFGRGRQLVTVGMATGGALSRLPLRRACDRTPSLTHFRGFRLHRLYRRAGPALRSRTSGIRRRG